MPAIRWMFKSWVISGLILMLLVAVYFHFNEKTIALSPLKSTFAEQLATEWTNTTLTDIHRLKNTPSTSGVRHSVPDDKLRVIILGYMHTGSTFLGSVLQQRPGTFYEYEPIRSNMVEFKSDRPMSFLNGTTRLLTRKEKRHITGHQISWFNDNIDVDFESEILQHRLLCKHNLIDIASLSVLYHKIDYLVNRDRKDFMKCQGHVTPKNENQPVNKTLIRKCLPLLTDRCKKSETIVHKHIRSNMNITERLLETFPNLKVIHLVRDPRAMMDSQVRKNDHDSRNYANFKLNTRNMCDRMRFDLRLAPKVRQRFGDRVMMVRQEDISEEPVKTIKSIFKFLGLTMTPDDINRIPERGEHIEVWRNHITDVNLKIVDEYCHDLYDELGYIPQDNIAKVRNETKPVYVPYRNIRLKFNP